MSLFRLRFSFPFRYATYFILQVFFGKPRPIFTGRGTNPKKPNYVFKIPATTFGHRAHI